MARPLSRDRGHLRGTPVGYEVRVDGAARYRTGDLAAARRSYEGHVALSEWREVKGWGGMVVLLVDARTGKVLREHRPGQVGAGRFAMLGAVSSYEIGASESRLDDVRAGRAVLKRGMRGAAVSHVQGLLGVPVDGDFGKVTHGAVENFQLHAFLKVDGVVGRDTLRGLEVRGAPRAAPPAPAPVATTYLPLRDPYATPAPATPARAPAPVASVPAPASTPAPGTPATAPAPYAPSTWAPPPTPPEWVGPSALPTPSREGTRPFGPPPPGDKLPPVEAQVPSASVPSASVPSASVPSPAPIPSGHPALALAVPGYATFPGGAAARREEWGLAARGGEDSESWFVRDTVIPGVPNAGVVVGGVTLGGGLAYLLKRLLSRAAGA